ncbi:MAG: hypothetical protein HY078_05435 [Elusimicrobia bacterium]|nr:hypothetical protein [Elusimicrobiota bacterium]
MRILFVAAWLAAGSAATAQEPALLQLGAAAGADGAVLEIAARAERLRRGAGELAGDAGASHECGSSNLGGHRFQWCIDRPSGPASRDVLYYLHSVFRDQNSWYNQAANKSIRAEWEKKGTPQPTVITVSFGSIWFFTDANGRTPLFVDKIMPMLEQRIGGVKGRRLLLGRSMGGFNAIQALLRSPRLFERVALLSPALLAANPHSEEEVSAYFARHAGHISKMKVRILINILKAEYANAQAWVENGPLQRLLRGVPKGARYYVSAGTADNYGFYEGAETFAKAAKAQGASVTWVPIEGGHRDTDPESVARFLAP